MFVGASCAYPKSFSVIPLIVKKNRGKASQEPLEPILG